MDIKKIDLKTFIEMFYINPHSVSEIAKHFGTKLETVSDFKKKYKLPPRGWAYGHPKGMLGKRAWNKEKYGIKSHVWNGGRTKTLSGYVLIYNLDYPIKNKQRYILEHRYVMEKHLKRKLKRTEYVHHINGKKDDNRLTNLLICSAREHTLHHPEVLFQKYHKKHSHSIKSPS